MTTQSTAKVTIRRIGRTDVDWSIVNANIISFFVLLILARMFKRFRKVECQ